MDENAGWIKLNRKILKWRWYRDVNTKSLFLHLLLNANVADHDFENITVHRGQLVTSYPHMALETGMSVSQVRTALNHLKLTGEVTVSSGPKYSIITIPNYNSYQAVRQAKRQANDSQMTGYRQQYKNIRSKEEKRENIKEKKVADWEKKIPEEFRGLFPNEEAWNDYVRK